MGQVSKKAFQKRQACVLQLLNQLCGFHAGRLHNTTHTVTLTSPFRSWGRGPASYLRKALHSCAKVWFSIGLRLHSFSLEIQPAWCRGSRERICSSVTKRTSSSISLIPALLLEHPHARHAGGTKQPTATCS